MRCIKGALQCNVLVTLPPHTVDDDITLVINNIFAARGILGGDDSGKVRCTMGTLVMGRVLLNDGTICYTVYWNFLHVQVL